ncbi:hypothetical protein ABT025_08850 [Streptomyces sp. NPDC002809]|uniref:hypothetical protein n=1 Tax=Streptomyces sp. NPDC002809 TaxID=3154433 RepID=UPI00331CB9FB
MAVFRNPSTVPYGAPAGSGAAEAVFVDASGVLRHLSSNGGLSWSVAGLTGGPYTLGGGDERAGGIVAVTGCSGDPATVNVFWTDESGTLGQLELTAGGWSDSPQYPVGQVPIVNGLKVAYSPPVGDDPPRPVLYGAQNSSTIVVTAFNGNGWMPYQNFSDWSLAPQYNGTVLAPTAAGTGTSGYPHFNVFFNSSGSPGVTQFSGSGDGVLTPWHTLRSPGLSGRAGVAGGVFPGGLVALTQAYSEGEPLIPACVYLDEQPDGERNLMVWPAGFTGAMALPVPNLGCRLAVAGQSVAGLNTTVYVIGSDNSVYAIPQISTCFNAQTPMMGPASQIYAGGSGTDPVQLAPDQVPGDAPALFVVGDDQSLWLYESSGRPGSYSATLPGCTGQWSGYQVRQNAPLPPVELVSPVPAGTALPTGSSVSTPLNTMLTVQPTGLLLTTGDTPVWTLPLDGVGGAMLTQGADLTVVDVYGDTLWASGTGTSPGASLKIVDSPPSVQILDGNGFPFWYSNRTQGPCSPGTPIGPGAQIAADGVVLVMQLDGNLVLLDRSSQPVWSTGTDGSGGNTPGHCAAFTEAGMLEVYDSTGANVVWSSAAFGGSPGDSLTLSSDPEPCLEITSGGSLVFRVGRPPTGGDATGCPPGWWFTPGTGMTGDGGSQLLMQADRLLLWDQIGTDYWSQPGSGAVFTTDGDLQLLDGQGAAIWKAGVNGAQLIVDKSPGTLCIVDDHGNNLWTVPPSG